MMRNRSTMQNVTVEQGIGATQAPTDLFWGETLVDERSGEATLRRVNPRSSGRETGQNGWSSFAGLRRRILVQPFRAVPVTDHASRILHRLSRASPSCNASSEEISTSMSSSEPVHRLSRASPSCNASSEEISTSMSSSEPASMLDR